MKKENELEEGLFNGESNKFAPIMSAKASGKSEQEGFKLV
jgi:hypothetical protein